MIGNMRVGGINAENSQLSDGRRALIHKCRDCDNTVRSRNTRLCVECSSRIFEQRQKIGRARALRLKKQKRDGFPPMMIGNLSIELAGLQNFWLAAAHRSAG